MGSPDRDSAQGKDFIAPPGYARHRPDAPRPVVAESSGFSLHAGVAVSRSQRSRLEHLARYVASPPVAATGYAIWSRPSACKSRPLR